MELYWRVCLVFDCPVLYRPTCEWKGDGRTSGLLLFSVQPFVASCVFVWLNVSQLSPMQKDWRNTWLIAVDCTTSSHQSKACTCTRTDTHGKKGFYVLIQRVRCIGHGVKNTTKKTVVKVFFKKLFPWMTPNWERKRTRHKDHVPHGGLEMFIRSETTFLWRKSHLGFNCFYYCCKVDTVYLDTQQS